MKLEKKKGRPNVTSKTIKNSILQSQDLELPFHFNCLGPFYSRLYYKIFQSLSFIQYWV